MHIDSWHKFYTKINVQTTNILWSLSFKYLCNWYLCNLSAFYPHATLKNIGWLHIICKSYFGARRALDTLMIAWELAWDHLIRCTLMAEPISIAQHVWPDDMHKGRGKKFIAISLSVSKISKINCKIKSILSGQFTWTLYI